MEKVGEDLQKLLIPLKLPGSRDVTELLHLGLRIGRGRESGKNVDREL